MKTALPRLFTVACTLIAASALADTKLVTSGAPLRYLVPRDGSLGGTWRGPGFNDSSWTAGQNGIGYEVNPGAFNASVIADSQAEFSATGLQGANSWINGYYDKATDPDGSYGLYDFQPFPRSDGPWGPDNFWAGSAWDWFNGDPPWDTIGSTDVHPNGDNNGGEHWVIRRWHSTAGGAITIRFHLRKSNLNGTGTTGKIFKNGVEIFSQAVNGNDGTGFQAYVNTTAVAGDVFDFAHTPVGPSGDTADGADGSIMTATILSGTIVPPTPPVGPVAVADSVADWSGTGVQGANGWYYGFYNKTADADGVYNPNTDFNMTDPNWTFSGAWTLGPADPPWDTIGQSEWHPNGDNNEHVDWVIRRWVSDVDGDLYAHVKFGKQNVNGGNGTTLRVFHNGNQVFSQTVAFNNGAGIDVNIGLPGVFSGDKIEFALDPLGTDGSYSDGADGSYIMASILTGAPPETPVADSVADWSAAGVQGANGWYYGFYNETADADHTYNPGTDFNTTDPQWAFGGGQWTLGPGDPPWDIIGQTDWHPNGDNNGHVDWVIRRWVSDVDGDLQAKVQFGKANVNGGNGTTLRVLHNGTQLFSRTVGGTDGTGFQAAIGIPGVFVGDTIEFALDPLGTDGSKNDGADGSFLRASILTGLPPEPPRPFVPGIADCFDTDIEAAMKGVNPSVFVRIPFNVANPAAIQTLKLKMKYNDGFVAYLNGTEIAKRNAPTSIAGITVANSITDWSTNPNVTVNGWSYGYYNQSLDPDGTYSGGSDMTPFPHDGGGFSPTDFWTGDGYDWFNGNPPWTELFREATHPAHPNGAAFDPNNPTTHIHWTVRRWNATVDANLKARVRFRKLNTGCGDGVRLAVFHNSVQIYSQTIAGNDGVGRDDTIDVPDVFLGDNIDVMLGPGDGNDFCDGTAYSVVLFEGEPSIPWDGTATAARTPTQTISPEVFDITSFISQLTPGANMLAIQGFNAGVSDNEFVINAELLANRVPVAGNDTVVAAADSTTVFAGSALLANDSDSDGDQLQLVGVTPTYTTAQGGTVRLYGDTVHYTPTAGFSGNDSFNYTVTDLSGAPIRAIVSVTVRPNQPPVANDDVVTTGQDTPVTFNVLANDTDPEGNTLKVDGVTSPPAHGIVVVQTLTGEATYTPSSGYFGPDAFTYSISDGHGGTASGVVHITVTPANQPPSGCVAGIVPPECTLAGAGGTPLVLSLNGTDGCVVLRGSASDPDGQALQYSWSANGTVFGTGAEVRNCFPVGCHTVTFTATDPMGASCSATVSFCVINPGEAVEQTVALVESTEVDRKNKRPLIASLKAAGASFDRGSFESGLNQLHAFQNKVRAQIAGANPAAAQALADSVQGIIDAVACSALVATQP